MRHRTVVFAAGKLVYGDGVFFKATVRHAIGACHKEQEFTNLFFSLLAEALPEPLHRSVFLAAALVLRELPHLL